MEFDFSEMFYKGYDPKDPNLASHLYDDYAFHRLQTKPYEEIPKRGFPFNHQRVLKQIFLFIDKIILVQEVGTGKCVLPNTIIQTSEGIMSIEHFLQHFEKRGYMKPVEGDIIDERKGTWHRLKKYITVKAYDPSEKTFVCKEITKIFKQFISEEVRKITLEDGNTMTMTKAHKVFNGLSWTNQIYKGDFICVPFNKQTSIMRVKVKSVEYFKYEGYVYDLEVKDLHNYIANGILCHNSCSISQALEQYRNALTSVIADYIEQYLMPQKVPYKKFLLVLKPSLIETMEEQLICKCNAKGVFDTKELREAKTKHMRTKVLNKNFRDYYKMVSYETFAKSLMDFIDPVKNPAWSDADYRMVKQQQLNKMKEMYSNTIFVFDEVHTLTTEKNKGLLKSQAGMGKSRSRFFYINEMLHEVENCKILLSTATPMKNRGIEFRDILNMILPRDEQIPLKLMRDAFPPLETVVVNEEEDSLVSEEDMVNEKTINKAVVMKAREQLLPYFRGKISYLRSMDTGIDVEDFHDIEINIMEDEGYPFYVHPVSFRGKEHIEAYKEAKRRRGTKNNDVYNSEIQLANGYLPPTGKERGGKIKLNDRANFYFKKKKGTYIYVGPKEFEKEYLTRKKKGSDVLPRFALLSPKAVETAEIAEHAAGKVMIFTNSQAMGVGIVSICLRYVYGFEPYEALGMFEEELGKEEEKPYCPTGSENLRRIRKGFVKKPRFAILFPKQYKTNAEILKAFNSYENRYGEYIKILIVSEFARQGINTNEVFTFINFDGHWNYTDYSQSLGRVTRADAFIWSLREAKEKALEQGQNPEHVRLTINVYNMSTNLRDEDRDENDDEPDIDDALYMTALVKNKDIQRVMRFIKETAIDCFIHYGRNFRITDEDFSPECNYERCKYECAVNIPPTGDLKYNMYDILYSQPEIEEAKVEIQKLFEKRPSYTFHTLLVEMPLFRPLIVLKAVYDIVKNRIPLVDSFGVNVYLREDNGTIFVQREFPNDVRVSPYSMAEYIYNTPIVLENTLTDVLIETAMEDVEKHYDRFTIAEVEEMDLLQKVSYLEETVKRGVMEGKDLKQLGKENAFFKRFENRFYDFPEVEELLQEQAKTTAYWQKRGRRPENIDDVKIKPIDAEDLKKVKDVLKDVDNLRRGGLGRDDVKDKVWAHALLTFETTAEFERFQKGEGIIRIMKESEGYVWRDANSYETVVYNHVIQAKVKELVHQLDKHPFYAYVLGDDLKIMEGGEKKEAVKKKDKSGKVDLRKRTKGLTCEKFFQNRAMVHDFEKIHKTRVENCEDVKKALEKKNLLIYLTV